MQRPGRQSLFAARWEPPMSNADLETIFVINPNSTEAVTRAMDDGLARLRLPDGPPIVCQTLHEGPPGVESQRDADSVIEPLCRSIAAQEAAAAAFVIACFSDPGLFAARETTRKPIFGIAECGILNALTLGHRFGVISILAASVSRHLRYIAAMGVGVRLAGDRPIGLGVTALADAKTTLARMIDVGITLRDVDGADVLVMGCAGMARYRDDLEEAVRLPVVEPTQAAVAMALGRVRLSWGNRLRPIR
jgi:allantoin racemase